jgi:hypothetical protein
MYEQYIDPHSDLALLAQKSSIKAKKVKERKNAKEVDSSIGDVVFSPHEIEVLKSNMLSDDSMLIREASNILGQIGGRQIVEFLIPLLDSQDPYLRNRAALALHDIKDDNAVQPLIEAILKFGNQQEDNSTLVFALQSLDCSHELTNIFKILFYGKYSEKLEAYAILRERKFNYDTADIEKIQQMWLECNAEPDKCPDYNDVKDDIQELVHEYCGAQP